MLKSTNFYENTHFTVETEESSKKHSHAVVLSPVSKMISGKLTSLNIPVAHYLFITEDTAIYFLLLMYFPKLFTLKPSNEKLAIRQQKQWTGSFKELNHL